MRRRSWSIAGDASLHCPSTWEDSEDEEEEEVEQGKQLHLAPIEEEQAIALTHKPWFTLHI